MARPAESSFLVLQTSECILPTDRLVDPCRPNYTDPDGPRQDFAGNGLRTLESPRPTNSEARDRVLNSAYTLFVQSGYTDVSMQQIADEAAITKATLYHHFRDKQHLYMETMRLAIDRSRRYFQENLTDSCDLRAILYAVVVYHFGTHKTDMQRLANDFRRYVDIETQKQFWLQFGQPWEFLKPALEKAIERGEVVDRDVNFLASYLYGSISGIAMTQRIHLNEPTPRKQEMYEFIDLLLAGIARTSVWPESHQLSD